MEDIKAYIESGILELYVLGELSASEMREVDEMVARHSEVGEELVAIERSLEKYAETYSVKPPENLRAQILDQLDINTGNTEAKVVSLESRTVHSPFYKYAFAACLALLVISGAALFVLYGRLQESNAQLAQLQDANQTFANRVNFMENQLESSQKALNIFHDPSYKLVRLEGLPKAKGSSMTVAWNKDKSEVMIDMAALKMPVNDQEHQYQLWALVDGKPVDLGVFDMNNTKSGMKKMKELGNQAQAFAVTLEPRGGSVNPTMEQMMAMGAISI